MVRHGGDGGGGGSGSGGPSADLRGADLRLGTERGELHCGAALLEEFRLQGRRGGAVRRALDGHAPVGPVIRGGGGPRGGGAEGDGAEELDRGESFCVGGEGAG